MICITIPFDIDFLSNFQCFQHPSTTPHSLTQLQGQDTIDWRNGDAFHSASISDLDDIYVLRRPDVPHASISSSTQPNLFPPIISCLCESPYDVMDDVKFLRLAKRLSSSLTNVIGESEPNSPTRFPSTLLTMFDGVSSLAVSALRC